MRRYVAAQPNGGYGLQAYRFEDHGLDADAEAEKFRPYLLHFGIEREVPAAPRKDVTIPAQEPSDRGSDVATSARQHAIRQAIRVG